MLARGSMCKQMLAYTSISSHILESAGPPLGEPPGCEEFCYHLLVPSPSNHLNHKLTVRFSFISSPFQSAISFDLSASGDLLLVNWLTRPQKATCYHPRGVLSRPWPPPGYPSKIIKFRACLQDPHESEKVPPGSPKDTKMLLKSMPRGTNLCKK